jgi:hypothetical protein
MTLTCWSFRNETYISPPHPLRIGFPDAFRKPINRGRQTKHFAYRRGCPSHAGASEMKHPFLLRTVCALAFLMLSVGPSTAADKPNILLIVADDHHMLELQK